MWKMVLILVLIVAVSWAVLSTGALRGPGDPMQVVKGTPTWLKGLLKTKLEASALKRVRDGCSRTGVELRINPRATCQMRVAQGGRRVRQADLVITTGTATVAFEPAQADAPRPARREQRLSPGQRFRFDVYPEGGLMQVQCAAAGGCTLRVGTRR